MENLTAAEATVRMLDLYGVRHVFGLCGDTSLPLYDALYRMDHGITQVLYRSPTLDWMAVDIRMDAGNVRAGTPRTLFSLPPMEFVYLRNRMDVLPDGSGFVTLQPVSRGLRPIRVRTGR